MGVFKIFPSQDTTIYTDYETLNAGIDSILDLSKNTPYLYPSSSTSRVLIKFDNDDIAEAVAKSGANFTASLKLYNAHVDGIPTNFNIEIHPIYQSWDMGTGRFNNIPNEEINISIANNKNIFYDTEYVKFRVYAREKYPQRVYAQQSLYIYNKLLPTSSYYSIIDLNTNLKIIDFDNVATKLSNDTTSSFFKLYMDGLEPDRYYKIQIKSTIDGGTYIYDDDYYFKVLQTVE